MPQAFSDALASAPPGPRPRESFRAAPGARLLPPPLALARCRGESQEAAAKEARALPKEEKSQEQQEKSDAKQEGLLAGLEKAEKKRLERRGASKASRGVGGLALWRGRRLARLPPASGEQAELPGAQRPRARGGGGWESGGLLSSARRRLASPLARAAPRLAPQPRAGRRPALGPGGGALARPCSKGQVSRAALGPLPLAPGRRLEPARRAGSAAGASGAKPRRASSKSQLARNL